jgi:hypothetical protein
MGLFMGTPISSLPLAAVNARHANLAHGTGSLQSLIPVRLTFRRGWVATSLGSPGWSPPLLRGAGGSLVSLFRFSRFVYPFRRNSQRSFSRTRRPYSYMHKFNELSETDMDILPSLSSLLIQE